MRRAIIAVVLAWAILWAYFYARAAFGRELPREDPTEVLP